MTASIILFHFEDSEIRYVGDGINHAWVAQDVCNVLAIKNARDAVADFSDNQKGVVLTDTPGGRQEMLTVTEPGLYRLIFKSRKKVAGRFQDWVFSEVLPSIRETGSYTLLKQSPEWKQVRAEGKGDRRIETDAIKEFIEYAKSQGSKSAEKYYVNLSRMENKALFLVEQKYPNLRERLGISQLRTIQMADRIVAKALEDGMNQSLHYKEIYKLAKGQVETFAGCIGQSPVPAKAIAAQEQPANYLAA